MKRKALIASTASSAVATGTLHLVDACCQVHVQLPPDCRFQPRDLYINAVHTAISHQPYRASPAMTSSERVGSSSGRAASPRRSSMTVELPSDSTTMGPVRAISEVLTPSC